jgi:anaerobic ribonucleoside-triphosphate reductase activating protein
VQALRDEDLLFRGSSNQRLVDIRLSREAGSVVEWSRDF